MMSPPHWHFAGFRLDPEQRVSLAQPSALPLPPEGVCTVAIPGGTRWPTGHQRGIAGCLLA